MPTSVFIQGHDGRMGKEISEIVLSNKKLTLVADMKKSKVIIDFSSPQGTMEALTKALQIKKPLLVGTTGLLPEHFKKLKSGSKKIPIFFSSNLSNYRFRFITLYCIIIIDFM